jgi:diacylglycerol kinase family enzyme
MRARLATGGHVPHPRIRQRAAALIRLEACPPAPAEVDAEARPEVTSLTTIHVLPGAYRLLV